MNILNWVKRSGWRAVALTGLMAMAPAAWAQFSASQIGPLPSQLARGQQTTMPIALDCPGCGSALPVTVDVTLPKLEYVGIASLTNGSGAACVQQSASPQVMRCTFTSGTADASVLTLNVQGNTVTPATGADIGSTTFTAVGVSPTTSTAQNTTSIILGGDLLSSIDSPANASVVSTGNTVTYTISGSVAAGAAPADAIPVGTVINMRLTIASGFTFNSSAPGGDPGWTCSAPTATRRDCSYTVAGSALSALPAYTIGGTVTAGNGSSITATSSISVGGTTPAYADINSSNNTSVVTLSVTNQPNLTTNIKYQQGSPTLADSNAPVATFTNATNGSVIVATASNTGGGNALASEVELRFVVPDGFISTLSGPQALSGFTCNNTGAGTLDLTSGDIIVCTGLALNASATASVSWPVNIAAVPPSPNNGNLRSRVTMLSGTETNTGDNTALWAYAINPAHADLSVTQSFSGISASNGVGAGTTYTGTLTVKNNGPVPAVVSVAGSDRLYATLVVNDLITSASTATAGWTCTLGGSLGTGSGTRQVLCERSNITLAVAGTTAVAVSLTVTAGALPAAPVTLTHTSCVGSSALTNAGKLLADGPSPGDPDASSTVGVVVSGVTDVADCTSTGTHSTAQTSSSQAAKVRLNKEVSKDNGVTWLDAASAGAALVLNATTPGGAVEDSLWFRLTVEGVVLSPTVNTLIVEDTYLNSILLNQTVSGTFPAWSTLLEGTVISGSPTAPAPTYTNPGASGTSSCAFAGSGTTKNLTCTFTQFAANSIGQIVVKLQRPLTSVTAVENRATVRSPDSFLTAQPTTPTATDSILQDSTYQTVQPVFDLRASASVSTTGTLRYGQDIALSLSNDNLGPNPVSAASMSLPIDPAFVIVARGCAVTAVGGTFASPATCDHDTSMVRNTAVALNLVVRAPTPAVMPGLPASTTMTATVAQKPDTDAQCEYSYRSGVLSTACNDTNAKANNTAPVTLALAAPQINLSITDAVIGARVFALNAGGNTVTYQLTAENKFNTTAGTVSRAEKVSIVNRLTFTGTSAFAVPAGLHVALTSPSVTLTGTVTRTNGYGTRATVPIVCTQASTDADVTCVLAGSGLIADSYLDAGEKVVVDLPMSITGSVSTSATLTAMARIASDESTRGYEPDYTGSWTLGDNVDWGNGTDNQARVNVYPQPRADLKITKTAGNSTSFPVGINQPVPFDLKVENLVGGNTVTKMQVTDTLPPGWVFLTGTVNTVDYTPSATTGAYAGLAVTGFVGGTACTVAAVSPATTPASQKMTCVVDGTFPSATDATNYFTVRVWARPLDGIYKSPAVCGTAINNTATAGPGFSGVDNLGAPLATFALFNTSDDTATLSTSVQCASIGGRTYLDRNGNNAQDGTNSLTDYGFANVAFNLRGTDLYGNAVSRTVTSNNTTGAARGDYLFDFLPPSNATGYTVTQTQPVGYINRTPLPGTGTATTGTAGNDAATSATVPVAPANSVIAGIQLNVGQSGVVFNFPEMPNGTLSSLAGKVYQDYGSGTPANDNNGIPDTGELGIANVTLTLTGVDSNGTAVNRTEVTDAAGTYLFAGLLPPNSAGYTVAEGVIPPASGSYSDGRDTTGNATVAAGNATAVNDQVSGIRMAGGENATGYNFGELQGLTFISGSVFNDRNRDGLKDASEPEIVSVTLKLVAGVDCTAAAFNYAGLTNPITTTSASGAYNFTPVPSTAQYTICETQPVGYADGPVGSTTSITIANLPLAGSTGNNFPEVLGSISGKVFADFGSGVLANNNNGTQQASEPGIGSGTVSLGVPVTLTGTSSAGPALPVGGITVYTDASGDYSFIDLFAGNYTITQAAIPVAFGAYNNAINTAGVVTPAGTPGTAGAVGVNTISALVLAAGSVSPANNFAKMPVTAITGTVYLDMNRNNTKEATPTDGRIGGVTLTLYQAATCTGTPVATTTTGTDGAYIFSMVSVGLAYAICETQPLGYGDAAVNPGTGGTTSAANVISIATLASTGSVANDFGEIIGSIAGFVYRDFGAGAPAANNNGVKEAGELGIANVPVTLTGTDAAGASVSLTVITDAAGAYLFGNLLAPSATGYTLAEGNIPAASGSYSDGKDTAGNASVAGGNATAVNDQISSIRIAGGERAIDYNFGELSPPIDLVVTKTTSAASALEGQLLSYTVRVKNLGSASTVGSYTVTDALPSGTGTPPKWTLESAAGIGWSCAIASDKLSVACDNSTVVQPGQENPSAIALGVKVGVGAFAFSPLRNVVQIKGGGEPEDKKPQPGELASPRACAANPEFNMCQLATPIVASPPDLVVTKSASKDLFTEGTTVGYVLRVKNIGQFATAGQYTVTDTLPATTGTPSRWSVESVTGSGWTCSISTDKLSVSCSHTAVLQPGEENPSSISLSINIGAGAAAFSPLRNTVQVSGGGEPDDKKPQPGELASPKGCAANPEFNVCLLQTSVQKAAGLSGHVWIDGGAKKVLDTGDKRLPAWIVEVYDVGTVGSGKAFADLVRGGGATRTTTTDAQGYYEVCGLEPNTIYRVLFRDPANRIAFPGVVTNEQGTATGADYWSQVKEHEGFQVLEVKLPASPGGSGCSGQGIAAPEQSLPLDPNGVVYDSKTRNPVAGAKVTLKPEGICTGYDPQLHIINYETYAKDAQGNPTMTTGDDGFYKFLLSGDPTAPQSCQFRLNVEQPVGYKPPPSTLIASSPPLQTPAGPGIYEVQAQKTAPTGNQTTVYHFLLRAGLAHREVFNNHIPLDPLIPGKLLLTKQGDRRLAEVGDTVLYTIGVRLLEGDPVAQITVRDRLPAGFTLVRGTVRLNNVPAADPLGGLGPVLGFNLGALLPNGEVRVTYRARVSVGAMQGDGINRAQAHACYRVAGCLDPASMQPLLGSVASNEAQHKVEVTGGVFTDNACVLGKVFVDCNGNFIQDAEELGIPGVRLYLESGQFMVTDSEGKYNRCGLTPRSHVLTVDPTTLPRGAILSAISNRNLGDANSLLVDLKNGELHRGDFAEGSCSNPVLEQVKARRGQGEVRSVETEKLRAPALRFQSKPLSIPRQGTDSANQPLVQPRQGASDAR